MWINSCGLYEDTWNIICVHDLSLIHNWSKYVAENSSNQGTPLLQRSNLLHWRYQPADPRQTKLQINEESSFYRRAVIAQSV
jgi:hypothetical protein